MDRRTDRMTDIQTHHDHIYRASIVLHGKINVRPYASFKIKQEIRSVEHGICPIAEITSP